MKFGVFVNPKRPKIPLSEIIKDVESSGLSYDQSNPDIAIVVGGDGTFGYYGRILGIPLLFVGTSDNQVLGSKARLAEIFYDDMINAAKRIDAGKFRLERHRMISVRNGGRKMNILTDVYLERGIFAGCLRYDISIFDASRVSKLLFREHAIGNGVIVTTSFGSSGYYSYLDRLNAARVSDLPKFKDNEIGICHIIPSFLVREVRGKVRFSHHLQYTIPFESRVQITLARDANARLYGVTEHSRGVPIGLGDQVIIQPSNEIVQIIRLSED